MDCSPELAFRTVVGNRHAMFRFNGITVFSGGTDITVGAEPGTEIRITVNDRVVHVIDFGPAPAKQDAAAPPRTYLDAPAEGRRISLELVPGNKDGRVQSVAAADIAVSVRGDVHGDVSTVNGSVAVQGDVRGDASSVNGNVEARDIHGATSTVNGNVKQGGKKRARVIKTSTSTLVGRQMVLGGATGIQMIL